MNKETLLNAIRIVGSRKRLIDESGLSASFLCQIVSGRRRMPLEACLKIERLTGGKVKREELNPAINWAELRSLMNE